MGFKNHFLESFEKIDNIFETLFEASGVVYKLTTDGLNHIVRKAFKAHPEFSKADSLTILNPSNAEDLKLIKSLKMKPIRVVLYTSSKGRIVRKDEENQQYFITKEFLSDLKEVGESKEEKEFLATLKERTKKNSEKTFADTEFVLVGNEIVTFLDLLKSSSPSKYAKGVYYVYNQTSNKLYEVIYNKKDSKFDFDKLFEAVDENEEFSLNAKAREVEAIQVLGTLFDSSKMGIEIAKYADKNPLFKFPYKDDPKFKSVISDLLNILDDDELTDRAKVLKSKFDLMTVMDWLNFCALAGGMSDFVKNEVNFKPHIVYKSIPEYRTLEDREGTGKYSMVELLVSNVKGKELLDLIKDKENKVSPNKDFVEVLSPTGKTLAKYYQITLKGSELTNLGKSQKYFQNLYGMIINSKEVFESAKNYEDLLCESILDKLSSTAKKGSEFLKSVGKELYEKIKFLFTAFRKWSEQTRSNLSKEVSKNVYNDAVELFGKAVEEAKADVEGFLKTLGNDTKNLRIHWSIADKKIQKLIGDLHKGKNADFIKIDFEDSVMPSDINDEVFKKQVFVYSFLKAFRHLVANSQNPLENYVDELLGLYIEAVFGSTELPLWKVFTAYQTPPYEFLGTKKSNKEERQKNILKNLGNEGIPLLDLYGRFLKGSYNINMDILTDIIGTDGNFSPLYTKFSVRYNDDLFPMFQAHQESERLK